MILGVKESARFYVLNHGQESRSATETKHILTNWTALHLIMNKLFQAIMAKSNGEIFVLLFWQS